MTGLDLIILIQLRDLVLSFVPYLVPLLLPAVWCAWWLGGVNWVKLWPTLAKGAWVPLVLLAILAALVWTVLQPSSFECPGIGMIPNGWWQSGIVALLVASALFCGWLQGYFGWTPQEISLEPPAQEHGHGHAHH